MNQYVLIFRRDFASKELQPSLEQLQQSIKDWKKWFYSIVARNILIGALQSWDRKGMVIDHTAQVTEGPYLEHNESFGGLLMINAHDYDQAVEIAKDCPILNFGGNVEIRQAVC